MTNQRCVKACLDVIAACEEAMVPWILGNPAGSLIWTQNDILQLKDLPHVSLVGCETCMYGVPWRASLSFLCSHCDDSELLRLSKRCCRRGGICERTLRRHKMVERNAYHYSVKLIDDLVYCLLSRARTSMDVARFG